MMTTPTAPNRGKDCPPTFELEAYSAGASPTQQAHLDGCASCSQYVRELSDGATAFQKARPPEMFLKQVARREAAAPKSLLRWLVPALGALAAAVIALVLLNPKPVDELTLKGADFRVLVKHGEGREAAVAGNDTIVRPGDRLRFAYSAPSEGYLAVLNLDGTEQVTTFFPAGGTKSAPVKPGDSALLEGTVTLDDAPGPEWMIAVFRTEPFDIAWLAEQLRGQSKRGAVSLDCPGCRIEMVRVQKGAP